MFKFIALLALVSFVFCDPYIRFVNQMEGTTLTIYSDKLEIIKLDFTSATQYYYVPSGSVSVTNVLNTAGASLTNGNPILLSFDGFATVALVTTGGQFTMVMLNESFSSSMDDSTKAYVRMIDLGEAVQYVSLAYVAGSINAYTGFLVATPFKPVDPASATEFRIFETTKGTYNAPLVTLSTSLTAGKAYTVFFFTPSGSTSATLALDHDISGSIANPTPASTSTSSAGTSTSADASSTSTSSTSSPIVSNHENSGVKSTAAIALASLCAMILLF